MSTTVNLSVGSGETKNLTFNCGGTFVPDDIEFVITGSGGDTNTTLSGNLVCTNSSSGTTNTAVSSGDVYLNYVENGSVVDSIALHGMGGTTITSTVVSGYPPQIRISSTTGGGGGVGAGSTISAVGSENQTLGYNAGSITIDGETTDFTVSPARATPSNGSQGVVRPIAEVTMSDMLFKEIDGGVSHHCDEIYDFCSVAGAPDFTKGGVFIPITVLYHYNFKTYKWESVPYLFVPSGLAEAFAEVYKTYYKFPI